VATYAFYPRDRLITVLEELRKERHTLMIATKSILVKVWMGDTEHELVITFSSSRRPLDVVKEEVAKTDFCKRGWNLDPFRIVNEKNAIVTDFKSIEDASFLIFFIPDRIIPVSGNDWGASHLDQLKVYFEDVELREFFEDAPLDDFEMSERCNALKSLLADLNADLTSKYEPSTRPDDGRFPSEYIRTSPLLTHPICKALFAAQNYPHHESFVDDFLRHLLHEIGFNEGSLYAAPQLRISLSYGSIQKMAIADVTIMDMLSFIKIGVVEDKNNEERIKRSDSTAQLVAEGIAIAQRNKAVKQLKRDLEGNPKATSEESSSSETVYGIRVMGYMFHFYAIKISPQIHSALESQVAPTEPTRFLRYESETGLNFLIKEQRDEIIKMLSLLQKVATTTGANSPRKIPS
jgi:hypothetical protein